MGGTMIKTKKSFKNFKVVNNVSVDYQDIYGLVGKNGTGKTTLFKLLMGLTDKAFGGIQINNTPHLFKERKNIGFMIGTFF